MLMLWHFHYFASPNIPECKTAAGVLPVEDTEHQCLPRTGSIYKCVILNPVRGFVYYAHIPRVDLFQFSLHPFHCRPVKNIRFFASLRMTDHYNVFVMGRGRLAAKPPTYPYP